MNEEFAIEPTALKDFKDVRFVLGKFGFHEGRYIFALPSDWVKEVYAQIETLNDGPSKLRAKELLRITHKERGGIVGSGVCFDRSKSWIQNVTGCGRKIAGILVSKETKPEGDNCQSIEIVEESFFGSTRESKVRATVEEFGRVAARLIEFSHEICLVDPYLFKNPHVHPSSLDVLKEFVRIGARGRCKGLVVYTEIKTSREFLKEHFQGTGVSILVRQIEQGNADDDLHPRYLLSKFGGIRFDKGFMPEDIRRDVSAIDNGMHKELCKSYLDGEHGFKILAETPFIDLPAAAKGGPPHGTTIDQ